MWYTYILKNNISGKFYIGCTGNIEKRIKEHNYKRAITWTGQQSGQWNLVYKEEYNNKVEAMARERSIKKQKSRKYIEKLLQNIEILSGTSSSLV